MKTERIVLLGVVMILISVIVPRAILSFAMHNTGIYSWYTNISMIFTVLFWIGILTIIIGIAKLMR